MNKTRSTYRYILLNSYKKRVLILDLLEMEILVSYNEETIASCVIPYESSVLVIDEICEQLLKWIDDNSFNVTINNI